MRDLNEPIFILVHPGLPSMNGNMSRKTKCTYINQNMQNLQNKYCEPAVYIAKHYVRVMTTTVKLAPFVEYIFLDEFFNHIGKNIFSRINSVRIFGTNLFSRLRTFSKCFGSKIKWSKI